MTKIGYDGNDGKPPIVDVASLRGVRCRVIRPAYSEAEICRQSEFAAHHETLSDRSSMFTLCGPGVPNYDEPTDDAPAILLIERDLFGGQYFHAQPPTPPDDQPGHYCGGRNYLFWDARSQLQIFQYPIGIHDHWERPMPSPKPPAGMLTLPDHEKNRREVWPSYRSKPVDKPGDLFDGMK